MKYIRTKNGKVGYTLYDYLDDDFVLYTKDEIICGLTKEEVLKQADTIEELCDEFVCESNEEGNDFFTSYKDKWAMLRDNFWVKYKEHYNFYGGIRIKNKGFIYVAKMNNKGDFELL